MDVTMLLADSAQVAENKLFVLGAGWLFTGPQMAGPMAIAALFEVPWNETNRPHSWRLELQDEDGHPVALPPQNEPMSIEGSIEVGRPPGHPEGTPLHVPLAFNFGPLPVESGRRYRFVMTIDGEVKDHWAVAFNMRPAGPQTV
ncbi:MAG TPA: hypothetical protein DIT48_07015 [Actinobacteria bacterium]|jgi:hypothetical protein|nr:hypothetical protein [Actinomycetota bacterium]